MADKCQKRMEVVEMMEKVGKMVKTNGTSVENDGQSVKSDGTGVETWWNMVNICSKMEHI